jgi:hypothetical protein
VEKLFIVFNSDIYTHKYLCIYAIVGGIFRELFLPFSLSTIAILFGWIEKVTVKYLLTATFLGSIILSLINLVSLYIGSTPIRIEYINHMIDYRGFQQFADLKNALIAFLLISLLAFVSKLIYSILGKTSLKAGIFITLVGGLFLFLIPSPRSYRYTSSWSDAIADVKTDITLDYTYKDPLTFFLNSLRLKLPTEAIGKLTTKEQDFLSKSGFVLPSSHRAPFFDFPQYKKIVFIVFEALDLDYLHFFNPEIPKEASSYFDELLKSFPHMTNFYTSNYPTSGGRYALIFSRIPYLIHFSLIHKHKSIFTLFKKAFPMGKTFYIRNPTQFYGGDQKLVREAFKMDKFICSDSLKSKYKINYTYEWGVRNDIIFKELVSVLENNATAPCMIFSKTIDGHFPYHYQGEYEKEIPDSIKTHPSKIVKTVYWNNCLLEKFFETIKEKGLFKDDTLFIITTDHTPNPNFGHKELVNHKKFQQLDKIPLVFVSSNLSPLKTLRPDLLCSQVDLPTTVCSLLGITPPKYYLGRDLLASRTIPLSQSHLVNYFYIKTASKSYAIPENEDERQLTWEESTISKYFSLQKSVEFNKINDEK